MEGTQSSSFFLLQNMRRETDPKEPGHVSTERAIFLPPLTRLADTCLATRHDPLCQEALEELPWLCEWPRGSPASLTRAGPARAGVFELQDTRGLSLSEGVIIISMCHLEPISFCTQEFGDLQTYYAHARLTHLPFPAPPDQRESACPSLFEAKTQQLTREKWTRDGEGA